MESELIVAVNSLNNNTFFFSIVHIIIFQGAVTLLLLCGSEEVDTMIWADLIDRRMEEARNIKSHGLIAVVEADEVMMVFKEVGMGRTTSISNNHSE
jgi:hypothetical protein